MIPRSKKLNPNVKLPKQAIAIVHRSDGSGTTFNFAYYLVGRERGLEVESRRQHLGAVAESGSAPRVTKASPTTSRNTKGSIGYVEYAYALQNKLTYTKMINKAGKTVSPTSEAFQAAAANADWKSQPGYGVILANQPGDKSWPMTAATWILIYKKPVIQLPPAKRSSSSPGPTRTAARWPRARLRSDAGQCREDIEKYLDERDQGRERQARVRDDQLIQMTKRKGRRIGALSLFHRRKQAACVAAGRSLEWLSQAAKSPRRAGCNRPGGRPVVDVALQGTGISVAEQVDRAKVLQRLRLGDVAFRHLTRAAAITVLIILGGIIVSLVWGSLPALRTFGISFLYEEVWNPVTEKFGAIAPIYGTIVTSLIAMLIAVPVGLFIALFLTELCPMWLRRPIGIAIELLAGIPSIIYGIWGLFVFAPFLQQYVQPFLIAVFGEIPVLSTLFAGPPYGIGILTAGLILAIMVLPFITSISRDVFEAVPPVLKEAAYGLGCTTWEVARYVVLPYTRVGVIGGVMLGLGRALGETMAVTFVIGNAHRISGSMLAPGTTISATIANEFTEAVGDLYTSALIALGLILFVITFIVLAIARLMLMRLNARVGG